MPIWVYMFPLLFSRLRSWYNLKLRIRNPVIKSKLGLLKLKRAVFPRYLLVLYFWIIKTSKIDVWCQFHQHFICAFLPISFCQKLQSCVLGLKFFWCQNIGKKRARKMLMKLTPASSLLTSRVVFLKLREKKLQKRREQFVSKLTS